MNFTNFVSKIIGVVLVLASAQAFAQVGQFSDTAKVVNVQPVMQQSAQLDCYQPQQHQQAERSYTGGVIGGLAGALLGAQVGNGNGRVAAAALGSVVGAFTGDRVDNRSNGQYVQTNCNTRGASQQIQGYLVTYEYNGRQGQKRMPYDPGQTIRVTITVDPL